MEKLITKLNQIVASGTKKSTLEKEIGLPENSLSAVLKGHKEMPTKWVSKIENYFKNQPTPYYEMSEPVPVIDGVVSILKNQKTIKVETISAEQARKDKLLQETLDRINKDFGAGSIMCLSDRPLQGIKVISTGSYGLDKALGVGGLPKGRIVEIYGQESSGKTTLALHVIAEAQKLGNKCAFIDAEHAFDEDYAKNIGVKINMLQVSQPNYGEEALEIADRIIQSGSFAVVVIDSVAALTPKSELDGEMGESKMGLHARLMSQAMRKMTATISKTNTICIFINQLREKIGIVYGSPYVTTGGNALKFYASVRLDVAKVGVIKDGDESLGNKVRVKVVKNKVSPPFKLAEFDIVYGEGINRIGEIVDVSVQLNIISKNGSWYNYNGNQLGQGRDSIQQLLKDNDTLRKEIENKIQNHNPEVN